MRGILLLVAFNGALCSAPPEPRERPPPTATFVAVAYIPFDAETFLPVSPVGIDGGGAYWAVLEWESPRMTRIMDLLRQGGPGSLDDRRVRVGVRTPEGVFYVDQRGVVRHAGRDMKLTEPAFAALEREIGAVVCEQTPTDCRFVLPPEAVSR